MLDFIEEQIVSACYWSASAFCLRGISQESDIRVLNVQDGLVREVYVEGHCWGCCDHICPMLLLEPLVEHLHVQKTQKPANTHTQTVTKHSQRVYTVHVKQMPVTV